MIFVLQIKDGGQSNWDIQDQTEQNTPIPYTLTKKRKPNKDGNNPVERDSREHKQENEWIKDNTGKNTHHTENTEIG